MTDHEMTGFIRRAVEALERIADKIEKVDFEVRSEDDDDKYPRIKGFGGRG